MAKKKTTFVKNSCPVNHAEFTSPVTSDSSKHSSHVLHLHYDWLTRIFKEQATLQLAYVGIMNLTAYHKAYLKYIDIVWLDYMICLW